MTVKPPFSTANPAALKPPKKVKKTTHQYTAIFLSRVFFRPPRACQLGWLPCVPENSHCGGEAQHSKSFHFYNHFFIHYYTNRLKMLAIYRSLDVGGVHCTACKYVCTAKLYAVRGKKMTIYTSADFYIYNIYAPSLPLCILLLWARLLCWVGPSHSRALSLSLSLSRSNLLSKLSTFSLSLWSPPSLS